MASEPTPVEPTSDAGAMAAAEARLAVDATAEAETAREFKQDVVAMTAAEEAPQKQGLSVRLSNDMRSNPGKWITIALFVIVFIAGFFVPVPEPHVQLGGEAINSRVPWWFTNSILTTIIVDAILILLTLSVYFSIKMVPSGIQNLFEMIIEYFYGLSEQVAGKAARTYFPWVMTIFLFVILSNWIGIIPGVGSMGWNQVYTEEQATTTEQASRMAGQLAMADGKLVLLTPDKVAAALAQEAEEPTETSTSEHFIPLFRAPSADLNMTFALAITTMVLVQIYGIRAQGGKYFGKFFTLRGKGFMKGINGFAGILELISEFTRIVSFGFRLFGNIFAGEIVLATMAFLITFILPVPFYVLEVFIGFVQSLVFAMLALIFFTLSTHAHGDDHSDEPTPADVRATAVAAH